MRHEPVGESFDMRNFVCFGAMVAFNPAFHLAFKKAGRIAECVKSRCLPVDGMNLYECVDHGVGDMFAEIGCWCYARREGFIYNEAFAAFHYIERRSNDVGVVAIHIGFWSKRKDRVDVL